MYKKLVCFVVMTLMAVCGTNLTAVIAENQPSGFTRHVITNLPGTNLAAAAAESQPHAGRTLIVYTTTRPEFYEPLLAGFQAETGIHLDFLRDGIGILMARLRAESANPVADVVLGGLLSSTTAQTDLFENFTSVNEPYVLENFRNTEGMMTRLHHSSSVLMVNTELIGDIPVRGYTDLLNPALRGKIAMTDPAASGSAFEHLINKLYAMGNGDPNAGWDYVEAFMENVAGVMLGSSSAVVRGVVEGEYLVALTFEEGPMPYIEAGAPVKMVYMEEGAIFNPGGVYIVKNTPNKDIAQLFVDYVTSYEPQRIMEQYLHRRSVRSDVVTDGLLIPMSQISIIYDDTAYVLANRDEWLDRFRDIREQVQ